MVTSAELMIFYKIQCNLGAVLVATSVDQIYKYNNFLSFLKKRKHSSIALKEDFIKSLNKR